VVEREVVMSNEEREDISKRLEEVEKAIGELRTGRDLVIMKTMAVGLCEAHCNIFTLFQKGEDKELWARRLAEAKQTIHGSETIEDVVKTRDNFIKEITDYVKAEKVDSTDKAVEKVKVDDALDAMAIANSFMKKDNPVALPLKAQQREDIWVVDVDIGEVRMEIVRVKIDAKTGTILGHETVEKK
jgi:hypothetical protein